MQREAIEAKMEHILAEMQKAEQEAQQLRPRLRYLEEILLRLDGAMTVLKGLLEEEAGVSVNHEAGP